MSQDQKLELISFKICPFVQRSVIALNEKQVNYKLTHLEMGNMPDWFKEISPTGKVPVLKVGDTPVFESAVIIEYLDEVYAPKLHPDAPLDKALHRSWIEFCSELTMAQFRMFTAKDQQVFEENKDSLTKGLQQLEKVLAEETPFFSGETFHLVDAVYAPLFLRLKIVEAKKPLGITLSERLQTWSDALLTKDTVKNSVVSDFDSVFLGFLQKQESYHFS
jgi:glutathione S-transferase